MWVAALAALAAQIGSATLAAAAKNASEEQAQAIMRRARDDFGKVDVPTLEQLAGQVLPPTELAKIQTNPAYAQAQLRALDKLQEMGQGGLTLQDQATENEALNKSSRAVQAQQGALRENMAARGTLGSGAELAMNLANGQAGANRANQAGMDAAAHAQQRAYDAIIQGGNLAGQYRTQDYNEKSNAAKAQDVINKYNATRQSDAFRDQFNMNMQKTKGMNGMAPDIVTSVRNQGNTNAALAGGIGTAAAGTATSLGSLPPSSPAAAPATAASASDGYGDVQEAPLMTSTSPLSYADEEDKKKGIYG